MSKEKPELSSIIECPKSVHWEPPKTEVKTRYEAVDRFLEDLGRMEDICQSPAIHPEYEKLRRFVCNGDVDAVVDAPWDRTIAFATYYLMFHRRNLETAQKVLSLLKSRNLDEKEKAALEILETADEVAANPPCGNPETLRLYAKKINGIQTYGWASLLKALVMAHLTCDPDYKDDIKLAILWTVKRCDCDNLSICYFAYRLLNRVKPLCSCPV